MSQAVEAPHAAANVPIKAQLPPRPNASNVDKERTVCRMHRLPVKPPSTLSSQSSQLNPSTATAHHLFHHPSATGSLDLIPGE